MLYSLSRKENRILFFVLILVHALGLWAALCWFGRPYSYDSVEYIQLASNLRKGIYYSGNAQLPVDPFFITLRPPVYSLFLLLCWTLFGQQVAGILVVQNLLSVFNCILVKDTFDRFYPGRKHAWLYALLVIGFPMQVVFANMVFSDILLQTFLMLYFRELLRYLQLSQPRRALKMALWLILAVFTKPVMFPFLFLQAVFLLLRATRRRQWLLLIYALLPLLLLAGYGQWNKQRTGLYHISSVQSLNLLDYNLASYYSFRYGPEVMQHKMDSIKSTLSGVSSFKERYERSAAIAGKEMKREGWRYACFHVLSGCQMFVDPNKLEFDIFARQFHYINNYQTSFMDSWRTERWNGVVQYLRHYPYLLLLLLTPLFGLLRLGGLALFFADRKNSREIRIVVAVFVLYFVAVTGPVANARYFLPLVLLTSACSWIGYSGFWAKRKTKKEQG